MAPNDMTPGVVFCDTECIIYIDIFIHLFACQNFITIQYLDDIVIFPFPFFLGFHFIYFFTSTLFRYYSLYTIIHLFCTNCHVCLHP